MRVGADLKHRAPPFRSDAIRVNLLEKIWN